MTKLGLRILLAGAVGLVAYAGAVLLLFALLFNGLAHFGSTTLEWAATLFAWGIGLAAAWAGFARQWRAPLGLAALAVLVLLWGLVQANQEEEARRRARDELTGPGRRAAINAFGPGAGHVAGEFYNCQSFAMVRVEGGPQPRTFWYDRRAGKIIDSVTDGELGLAVAAALGPEARLTSVTVNAPHAFTFSFESGGNHRQGTATLGDDCALAISRIDRGDRSTGNEVQIPLTPLAAAELRRRAAAADEARRLAGTGAVISPRWYRFSDRGLWLLATREGERTWLWYDLEGGQITRRLTEAEMLEGIRPALPRGWSLDGLDPSPESPHLISLAARKGAEAASPAPELTLSPEGRPEGSLRWSGPVRPDTQRQKPVVVRFGE